MNGLSTGLPLAPMLIGCAALCTLMSVIILWAGSGRTRWLLAAACAAPAAWATVMVAAPGTPDAGLTGGLEIVRDAAWLVLLLHLFGRASGRRALLARRFVWLSAGAVLVLLLALLPGMPEAAPTLRSPALAGRLALSLILVLIAENLFRNATEAERWHVNLPCIAIGGLAALDVVTYADAALMHGFSYALLQARVALAAIAAPLLAVAAVRDRRLRRGLSLSRQAVFHGATLVVGGAFLFGVGAAGEVLRRADAAWGQAAQISLLAGAVMAVTVAIASRSARSRIRRAIVDNVFTVRFDYRREWMRCIAALSNAERLVAGNGAAGLTHAIQAVANAVDSPGGVLLLRDDGAPMLRWAESWNMPTTDLGLIPDQPLTALVRGGTWIAEFDPSPNASQRKTPNRSVGGSADEFAGLHLAFGPLWLAVPLLRPNGLLGVVLLARPRGPFPLDREVCDLLRALGQNVALFLAERQAAEQIAASRQLHDYAKRFAFVAHDVKNVATQLRLVLGNAEHHMQNPDFQRDLISTVTASADRIDSLIARLRQPDAPGPATGAAPSRSRDSIDPVARLRAFAAASPHPVQLDTTAWEPAGRDVGIGPARFDDAVTHLLDNAVEASAPGMPVHVRLRQEHGRAVVDIADTGPGMTPEFIRDELFRPLSTSKREGNGIGAWQARELLRGAGGELAVLSRPGVGTTMRLLLPLHDLAIPAVPPAVSPITPAEELSNP